MILLITLLILYQNINWISIDTNIQEPDKTKPKNTWRFLFNSWRSIKTQCDREQGIANENEKTRATVSELCVDELEGLLTNNLRAKRDFSNIDS